MPALTPPAVRSFDVLEDAPREDKLAAIIRAQVVVLLLATAFVVYPSDGSIAEFLQDFHPTRTPVGRTLKLLGKFDVVFLFMLFLCWAGGNRRMLWRFVPAAVTSGLLVPLVKIIVGRPRPNGDNLSFPSGDSSIAFVWATVVAAEYPVLAAPCFVAAAGVALMRITARAHYPSDILVGSAIGFAAAGVAIYTVRNDAPEWLLKPLRQATGAATKLARTMLPRLLGRSTGSTDANTPDNVENTSADQPGGRSRRVLRAVLIVSGILLYVVIRAFTNRRPYPVLVLAGLVMALALGWFLARSRRGRSTA